MVLSSCSLKRDLAGKFESDAAQSLMIRSALSEELMSTEFKEAKDALVKLGPGMIAALLELFEEPIPLQRQRILVALDVLGATPSLETLCQTPNLDEASLRVCISRLNEINPDLSQKLLNSLQEEYDNCASFIENQWVYQPTVQKKMGRRLANVCAPPPTEFRIIETLDVTRFPKAGSICKHRVPTSFFVSDALSVNDTQMYSDLKWANDNILNQCVDVCYEVKQAYKIQIPSHLLDIEENKGKGDITPEEIEFLTFLHDTQPSTLNIALIRSMSQTTVGEAFYTHYPSPENQKYTHLMHSAFLVPSVFQLAYFTVLGHEMGHVAFDQVHVEPIDYLMHKSITRKPPYKISTNNCDTAITYSQQAPPGQGQSAEKSEPLADQRELYQDLLSFILNDLKDILSKKGDPDAAAGKLKDLKNSGYFPEKFEPLYTQRCVTEAALRYHSKWWSGKTGRRGGLIFKQSAKDYAATAVGVLKTMMINSCGSTGTKLN